MSENDTIPRPPLTLPPLPMSQVHRGTSGGVGWMKAHLKIFADPGERSDIVRVSFGIVRGRERVSGVNCVYFLEQTVGKRRHLIMTTSSAGGLLCGYKPVVLAGSKEPLKIRHMHSYHRQALKGFSLCLIYRLTRKRVNVFLQ